MLQGSGKMSLAKHINFWKLLFTSFQIAFLMSALLVNCLQFLVHTFIKPFSKYVFRKCNYFLSYTMASQIVFLFQYWADAQVTVHYSESDFEYYGNEQALLLMNHSYEIDWMLGHVLCDYFKTLGNVQTVAKKAIQYMPTLGYSWKVGGSIFVERNWEKDEKIFKKKMREMIEHNEPFWLMFCAEGTRFTPEKHEASNAFAREKGLQELRYHLLPRTKGFASAIPIVRNKMAAVYNVNMGFRKGGVKPILTNILLGKSINSDVYVERIPMKELPETEADLSGWLHSIYRRKDDLMHSYNTTGHWKAVPNPMEYKSFTLQRRLKPAVNFACWYVAMMLPFGYYLMRLLVVGDFFSLLTVGGLLGSCMYLLDKLAGESRIGSTSSYGTSKNS